MKFKILKNENNIRPFFVAKKQKGFWQQISPNYFKEDNAKEFLKKVQLAFAYKIIKGTKWHTFNEKHNQEKVIICYDLDKKEFSKEINNDNYIWIYIEDILPNDYLKFIFLKSEESKKLFFSKKAS